MVHIESYKVNPKQERLYSSKVIPKRNCYMEPLGIGRALVLKSGRVCWRPHNVIGTLRGVGGLNAHNEE